MWLGRFGLQSLGGSSPAKFFVRTSLICFARKFATRSSKVRDFSRSYYLAIIRTIWKELNQRCFEGKASVTVDHRCQFRSIPFQLVQAKTRDLAKSGTERVFKDFKWNSGSFRPVPAEIRSLRLEWKKSSNSGQNGFVFIFYKYSLKYPSMRVFFH